MLSIAYLCLALFPVMAGDADVVEEAVQLADDGRHLLGEVASVHCDCRPASAFVNSACTGLAVLGMVRGLYSGLARGERRVDEECVMSKAV
jgi:hypothetical protein